MYKLQTKYGSKSYRRAMQLSAPLIHLGWVIEESKGVFVITPAGEAAIIQLRSIPEIEEQFREMEKEKPGCEFQVRAALLNGAVNAQDARPES